MKIVALTGGIGSGKSTVAEMFKALGVPVYNSDKEAKTLLNSSEKLQKDLILLLGEEAYLDKKLNKTYVAEKIFGNRTLLQKMNEIIHPAVRKDFLRWTGKRKAPYVIQEAAIIFESGNQHNYDVIILVTAPQNTRIERVMRRDGISREQVLARMDNQWSDAEKIALSDFIIENTHMEDTAKRVSDINSALLNNC